MDLDDLEHNTRDGLHIASLAGTWIAAVAGFGGMRDHGGRLRFMPRLPDSLARLRFKIRCRGRAMTIEVTPKQATYTLYRGEDLEIMHHGELLTLSKAGPLIRPIPAPPALEQPVQPRGRAPRHRRPPR